MVKGKALEVPPPGAGLNTVTWAVPPVAMSLAGMAAVTCVVPTKVVGRFTPFQRTTEEATKLLPLTAGVKAGPPAVALLGESKVRAGTGLSTGLLMVNVRALEVPPPGAGLNTVTWAVPSVAMSLAGMAAVTFVVLTKVVGRFAPFQRTTEEATKLLPVTVSVKSGPPAVALLGESKVRAGTALTSVAGTRQAPRPWVKAKMFGVPATLVTASASVMTLAKPVTSTAHVPPPSRETKTPRSVPT
jgi:hypothetical protein